MPSETRQISPYYVHDMNHLRFIESAHRVPMCGRAPSRTYTYNALPRYVYMLVPTSYATPWIRLLKIKIYAEYTDGILKCKINKDKTRVIFIRIFKIPTEKYDVRRKKIYYAYGVYVRTTI